MAERIGALRQRVRLQSPARAEDDLGGAALNWTDEGEVWAAAAAGGAVQRADYDSAPAFGAYTLTIDRRADVRPGWRALWRGRVLRIVGIRDAGEARLELVCEEERL